VITNGVGCLRPTFGAAGEGGITGEIEMIDDLKQMKFISEGCFYCGSNGPFQMDHFPVPARHRGSWTVKACLHCHNLKDRISVSMFFDYVRTQSGESKTILAKREIEFLLGSDDIKDDDIFFLVGDVQQLETPFRLWLGRRLASYLDGEKQ
jgi:hypothetical protein